MINKANQTSMPDIINTPQPEKKKYSAEDKEGAAIWIAREKGEPTRERIKAFEEKYNKTLNEWARSVEILDGRGIITEKAPEILEKINQ